jgi:hypothetical protein
MLALEFRSVAGSVGCLEATLEEKIESVDESEEVETSSNISNVGFKGL